MDDLINRADLFDELNRQGVPYNAEVNRVINGMPSERSEQIKMIKEIRKWINSGNRGSADYFIVDKIEEIINKYER